MKRSVLKKIIAVFLCAVTLACSNLTVAYAADSDDPTADTSVVTSLPFEVKCKSAFLMDSSTGTVLYELNPDEALPPASVTKIMTLLLVMEAIDSGALKLDDMITASANAVSMGGSQIYLKEGEQMTAEDMIKSVVISSANDAAVALAEHVAGSEEAFVERMNKRAEELGMKNTHFENTNGLDDTVQNHATSARDIAIMSAELIKHEKILEYSSIWMDTIRNGEFGLTNTNRLVRFYNGATGLKTGSTSKAKFCVSATAKRDGMHLVCVVMGADTRDERNAIASKLLDYGFANYSLFHAEGKRLDEVKILGGVENTCGVGYGDFSFLLNKGEDKNVTYKVELNSDIAAPIKIGDVLGKVTYSCRDKIIGEVDIVSTENIDKIGFFGLLKRILAAITIK